MKSNIPVLEIVGWVAVIGMFAYDWFRMIQPHLSELGIAGVIGSVVGMTIADVRISVPVVCLIILGIRRRKRNFPKEPNIGPK